METISALLAICSGNSSVPVKSPRKGQWREALMFSSISAWINGWVNNRKAGDLRRNRAHYDVIVIHSSGSYRLHIDIFQTSSWPCSWFRSINLSREFPPQYFGAVWYKESDFLIEHLVYFFNISVYAPCYDICYVYCSIQSTDSGQGTL